MLLLFYPTFTRREGLLKLLNHNILSVCCSCKYLTSDYSAFAFNEIVEIFTSVAETVMCLSFTHDFYLHPASKCIEMVGKTIFFKSGEVVRIVVMCKMQTLHQFLQQTNFPTISSKANSIYIS